MGSNSVPLLIGASDQAAYRITPSAHLHMMFIGDLTDRPTHAIELLSQQEWTKALRILEENRREIAVKAGQ